MAKYMNARGFRILAALDAVAARHEVEPAAIAMAWLTAQPTIAAPIASATSLAQFRSLAAGAELALSPVDLDALDRAAA